MSVNTHGHAHTRTHTHTPTHTQTHGITPFVPGAVYPGRGALDKRRVALPSVPPFIQVLQSVNF